jgi:hypothetical protein
LDARLDTGHLVAGLSPDLVIVPCSGAAELRFEAVTLTNGAVPIKVNLLYRPGTLPRRPVILMTGAPQSNQPPAWSPNLVNEGYLLAALNALRPRSYV